MTRSVTQASVHTAVGILVNRQDGNRTASCTGIGTDCGVFDMAKKQWVTKPQPGENANNAKHIMKIATLPQIDQTDKQEVAERIEQYFDLCIEDDMRPTVAGLALALGTNRTSLFQWKAGKIDRIPDEVAGLVDRAIAILNAEQEEAIAVSGNIVGGIFLMKNSFEEYTDRREVIHKVEQKQLTQQELIEKAKQLPGF